ncbi:hypothetical protein ACFOLC_05180 [Lysobacter cavernae]|uniref:Tryptophan-rich sensory protein n=1 Tax=Lysobacter cavernae TaxID=1685901 RepID=A0ABV7RP46_9GAMM
MRYLVVLAALLMPVMAWFTQRGAFGPGIGATADRYPTLLDVADYAFAIWALIFLWDLVFAFAQLHRHDHAALARTRPAAAAGFAFTALWMPLFSQQLFWPALLVIWLALACLAYCAVTLSRDHVALRQLRWRAWFPLSLHAGWLSLAVFLNTAQVIVAQRLLSPERMLPWNLALYAAAAALLLTLNARMHGNLGYVLAALWGLAAAYVQQSAATAPGARVAAGVAVTVAVALLAQSAWLRARVHRHIFSD